MSAAGVSERQPNLAEVRELITATTAALKGISRVAYQAPNGRVGDVAAELGGVGAFANAGLVTMTAEAEQRGEVQESQSACTAGWLRDSVWHLRTGGSGTVAKCAATLRRRDLGVVADAVRAADLTPAVAVTVAAEFDKLAPELAGGAEDAVLGAMIDMGAEHGSGSIRRLRESLLAGCGRDGALQDEQDARRRYVSLSAAREESGIFNYGLTLDAEGRAVLEAAIGPLSAPQPGPDGEHDPGRSSADAAKPSSRSGDRRPGSYQRLPANNAA